MAWKQLSVVTSKACAPDIADLFSSFGAVSVTYMDAADQPVYEPKPGETKIWQQTKVIGLFEMDDNPEIIEALVTTQLDNRHLSNWQLEILEDRIWERAWLDHYQPMLFGDKLWVCPTGMEKNHLDCICLTLDPGLAFGTGTHATTALCLEWLAGHDLHNKSVIDYGCGSGILAIAAVLLGADYADAVDIDPQALTATRDNALKNNIKISINCYISSNYPEIKADLLIANILAKPLIELVEAIAGRVKPGGNLVLSGILYDQADAINQAYGLYFDLKPPVRQDDWCRIEGVRY